MWLSGNAIINTSKTGYPGTQSVPLGMVISVNILELMHNKTNKCECTIQMIVHEIQIAQS